VVGFAFPMTAIPRDSGDHQIACVAPALLPVGLGFDLGKRAHPTPVCLN
jgi:hypothetical protein